MELTIFTESIKMNQLRSLKAKLKMYTELNNKYPNNKEYIKQLNKYKNYTINQGLKVDK
tara:strand:+ start:372 stop:548 length:177 start_codon:yes stop_codon:yes gene_type:complete